MLEVELAFGGQIVMLTPTKITLVTYVLDCEDHATYEGPIGEMESLCQLSVTILQGERQFKGVIIEGAWHSMEQTFGMKVGKPLLMKMLAGIAFGRSHLGAAVHLSAGINNEDDVGLAVESKVSLKDLAACADLARQSGMPFRKPLRWSDQCDHCNPVEQSTGFSYSICFLMELCYQQRTVERNIL